MLARRAYARWPRERDRLLRSRTKDTPGTHRQAGGLRHKSGTIVSVGKGVVMALSVRTMEYFYTRVEDEPGKAYELLTKLASEDINLLAFSAVPYGPNHVELTIFPDQPENFVHVAKILGWTLTGPQHACLIQGD